MQTRNVIAAWLKAVLVTGAMLADVSLAASAKAGVTAKAALPNARETVSTVTEGTGATAAAALSRALANAAQQVTGSHAMQAGDVETQVGSLVAINPRGELATGRWTSESTGRTVTLGGAGIRSFQVLSQRFLGKEQGWSVRVRADVYKIGGADAARDAQPRLAIVPVYARDSDVAFPAIGSRDTVLRRFRARLQQSLLQSGQVRVLDRDNFNAAADELMVAGDSLRADNLAKLGQRFAADYVVVVDTQRLRLVDRGREMYGAWQPRNEAELQLEIRVIDVATQELIKSTEVQKFWTQADLLAIADREGINYRMYPDRYQESLLRALATHAQAAIVNLIVPGAGVNVVPAEGQDASRIDPAPARETPGSSDKPFSW